MIYDGEPVADGTGAGPMRVLIDLSRSLQGHGLTAEDVAHRLTAALHGLPGVVEARLLRLPGGMEMSRAGAAPSPDGTGLGGLRVTTAILVGGRTWGRLEVLADIADGVGRSGLKDTVTLAGDLAARALGEIDRRGGAGADLGYWTVREALGARLDAGMTVTEALHGEAPALLALVQADVLAVRCLGEDLRVGCSESEHVALLTACGGAGDDPVTVSSRTLGDWPTLREREWDAVALLPLGEAGGDGVVLARRAADGAAYTDDQVRDLNRLHRFLLERFAWMSMRRRGLLGRLLARVSDALWSYSVGPAVAEALRIVSEAVGADCAVVVLPAGAGGHQPETWAVAHQWVHPAVAQAHAMQARESCPIFYGHLMEGLSRRGLLRLSRGGALPEIVQAGTPCPWIASARSTLVLPVMDRRRVAGAVVFTAVRETRSWTDWDVRLSELAIQMIGHALRRRSVAADDTGGDDRFRALFHQSREALFLLDHDARVIDLNRAAEEITGFSLRDFTRTPTQRIVSVRGVPLSRIAVLARLSALESGRLGVMEVALRRPDGVRVPLELTMRRFEPSGRALFLISAEDISARKAAEAAAQRRAARDELMLTIAKQFVRKPLDTAAASAFGMAGTFLNGDAVFMQDLSGRDGELLTRLTWRANPDACGCPGQLETLPKARLGLEVGRPWRWSSRDSAGPLDRAPDMAPAPLCVLAMPVLVDGGPVGQIILTDCRNDRRVWSEEEERLLSFLAEMYAMALSHVRERTARAATEQRLEAFASNLPGVIWRRVLQADGTLRYTYLSGNLPQFIGHSAESVIRDPQLALRAIHPGDRDRFTRSVHAAARAGADWSLEFRVIEEGGQVKWAHATGLIQTLPDGSVAWDGLTLDITALKRSEQALRESEMRFRAAFNQAAEGMALVGPDGGWLLVNQSLGALLRSDPEHIEGTAVIRWVDDRDRRAVVALRRRAATDPASPLDTQMRARRADGTVVWVRAKVAPVFDDAGVLLHWVAHVQDVSAQRATQDLLVAARDQAEATARAKSDFLAMMSHEIRTPLSGMIGLAQLMQREVQVPAQRRRAGRIESAGRLLLGMLDDILTLSKAESGIVSANYTAFSPSSLVSEVLGLLTANAETKGLRLFLDLDPDLPARVVGPEAFIRQVLFNLGGNAVKFTQHGRVVLRARWMVGQDDGTGAAGPPRLAFEVEDTGIGIEPGERDRLFDAFSQGAAAMARRTGKGSASGGVGLGLAICRRMVDAMDGELGLDSVPGQGSRFWFHVPLTADPGDLDEAADSDPPLLAVADAEPSFGWDRTRDDIRVFVVDDDDLNREILAEMLAVLGCRTTGFPDGAALLKTARVDDPAVPDLILMDLNMPGLTGAETARSLHAIGPAWAAVPVLGVTAGSPQRTGDGSGTGPALPGMKGCLRKPVGMTALRRALERHVKDVGDSGSGSVSGSVSGSAGGAPAPLPQALAPFRDPGRAGGPLPVLDTAVWTRRLDLLGPARLSARLGDLEAVTADLSDWARGDTARVPGDMAGLAHRVKGAAATLGANRLAAAAGRLEQAILTTGPSGDPDRGDDGSVPSRAPDGLVIEGAIFRVEWAAARAAFETGLAMRGGLSDGPDRGASPP
jgi:PAS domain S-box-containing protein